MKQNCNNYATFSYSEKHKKHRNISSECKEKQPVHDLASEARLYSSEQRHLGPDFVFTHICSQVRFEHGSVNRNMSIVTIYLFQKQNFISNILYNYEQVVEKGKMVNFCWIPSHISVFMARKRRIICNILNSVRRCKILIPNRHCSI